MSEEVSSRNGIFWDKEFLEKWNGHGLFFDNELYRCDICNRPTYGDRVTVSPDGKLCCDDCCSKKRIKKCIEQRKGSFLKGRVDHDK